MRRTSYDETASIQMQAAIRRVTGPIKTLSQKSSQAKATAKASNKHAMMGLKTRLWNRQGNSSGTSLDGRTGSVVIAAVNRTSEAAELGLSLQVQEGHRGIFVGRVDPNGMFARTPLRQGMVIFQIDERNVENLSLDEVGQFLQSLKGTIRVWAEESYLHSTAHAAPVERGHRRKHSGRCRFVEDITKQTILVAAKKDRADKKLGITLARSDDGVFTIGYIHPSSPLHNSLLREGMIVKSVDGLYIPGRRMEVAISAIRDAESTVLIGVEVDPTKDLNIPNMIRRRIVTTSSHGGNLGVSLIKVPTCEKISAQGLIVVHRIAPGCPFQELEVGMEIKAINGTDISEYDVRETMRLLKSRAGRVKLVCEMDMQIDDMSLSSRTTGSSTCNSTAGSFVSYRSALDSIKSNDSMKRPSVVGSFSASAVKENAGDRLGVMLEEDEWGSFFVLRIAEDSPFRSTNLHAGAEIVSVNGVVLSGMDMQFVGTLLQQVVGRVELQFLPSRDSAYYQEHNELVGWC